MKKNIESINSEKMLISQPQLTIEIKSQMRSTTGFLNAAVKHNLDAVKYIEDGNKGRAVQSLMIAQAHLRLASETLIEDMVYPAIDTEAVFNHTF